MIDRPLMHHWLKLHSPSYLEVDYKDHCLPSNTTNLPFVTLSRDQMIEFSNAYKIMGEMIGLIVGNSNFSLLDIEHWYREKESYLERKRCLLEETYAFEKTLENYKDIISRYFPEKTPREESK